MGKFKLFLASFAFAVIFFSGCASNEFVPDGNSSGSVESSLSSSSRPVGTLSCGSVVGTGTVGQPLTVPSVTCNGSAVTGAAIAWSGAPDWNTPAAGTYNVTASVIAGACKDVQAPCAGTLVVSQPSSSSSPPSDNIPVPTLENLNSSNARTGTTTRYWDACKPSCAWPNNTSGSPNGTAKSCDVKGSTIGNNSNSACGGGNAYTCMNQAPWRKTDNVSYGFAASTKNGDCGKCFHIQFTNTAISGKKMILMISNIGGDVKEGAFDMMIPGGGVGQFNALSNQVSQNGGSSSNLGAQYGGFRSTCGNNATCVRNMCNTVFSSAALADLKAGCLWYVDWFQIADNPNTFVKEITCPSDLVGRYK
jgi:hypothetical protein